MTLVPACRQTPPTSASRKSQRLKWPVHQATAPPALTGTIEAVKLKGRRISYQACTCFQARRARGGRTIRPDATAAGTISVGATGVAPAWPVAERGTAERRPLVA